MKRPRTSLSLLIVSLLFASFVAGPPPNRAAADWSPPSAVYVSTSGHTLSGVFLDVWRAWGGAASWGDPISEEIVENGRTVQYFAFARFEYWPEDTAGSVVHFGSIGSELRPVSVTRPTSDEAGDAHLPCLIEQAAFERAWLPNTSEADRAWTATWRYVPETGHSIKWGFKSFWEATGEAAYLGYPVTEEFVREGITYQVFERGELAWQEGARVWMVPVGWEIARRHDIETAPVAQGNLPDYSEQLWVPPKPTPDPSGARWIEVNLSWQYLTAWQGDVAVLESYVSTGRAGFETPTGTFSILSKLESQDMEGVIGGEYYNVPGVPWVMYFTSVGHALHGTYWHSNFGTPMSHGCVNLPIDVAYWLYQWAPIGTPVVIHY